MNLPPNQQHSNGTSSRPRVAAWGSAGHGYPGAIVRRKWLIILPTILGTLLGFLYFSQQPPVYGSSLKLMIWTQAPPSLVHGETVVQTVSLGKHLNLLGSQVVLARAIREGKLSLLQTFRNNPVPLVALKSMLRVAPVPDAEGTLTMTLRGPIAAETPVILEHIAKAYQSILSEDIESTGQESAEIIEKLQSRIEADKNTAENRYLELIRKLNIAPDAVSGQFTDPYAQRVVQMQDRIDDQELVLREMTLRLQGLRDLDGLPPERRAQSAKVVALEAAKYLSVSANDARSALSASDPETARKQDLAIGLLEGQVESTEAILADLRVKAQKIAETVGERHPRAKSSALEISF